MSGNESKEKSSSPLQFSRAFNLAGYETINDKLLMEMNERARKQLESLSPQKKGITSNVFSNIYQNQNQNQNQSQNQSQSPLNRPQSDHGRLHRHIIYQQRSPGKSLRKQRTQREKSYATSPSQLDSPIRKLDLSLSPSKTVIPDLSRPVKSTDPNISPDDSPKRRSIGPESPTKRIRRLNIPQESKSHQNTKPSSLETKTSTASASNNPSILTRSTSRTNIFSSKSSAHRAQETNVEKRLPRSSSQRLLTRSSTASVGDAKKSTVTRRDIAQSKAKLPPQVPKPSSVSGDSRKSMTRSVSARSIQQSSPVIVAPAKPANIRDTRENPVGAKKPIPSYAQPTQSTMRRSQSLSASTFAALSDGTQRANRRISRQL